MSRIRILLVDDHLVVRKGIATCLARFNRIEVVGEANGGEEALLKVAQLHPDIVLMDLDMPGMSGIAAAELMRRQFPQTRVLILTMLSRSDLVLRMIQSGVAGYLLKSCSIDELTQAIERVHSGQTHFAGDLAQVALERYVRVREDHAPEDVLTCREREVLIQIAEGLSNKEIACRLGVGVRTIETHRERVMRKLNVHSVAGLTRFAIARGLVALEPETSVAC